MKVLLVRLSSMGDLIHTLPAITDLAQHCPNIELHWLCEAGFSDVARLHPFVRQVIPMHWRQWSKQLLNKNSWQQMGLLKQTLQNNHYDCVLDSQGLIKSAIFAKFAQAPIKGLDWNSAREPLASLAYQEKITVPKGHNAIWRNRQLFAQVFAYTPFDQVDFGAKIPIDIDIDWLPYGYHIALHATSRDSKLWSETSWITLLQQMFEYDGLPVVLPWGNEQEKLRAKSIATQIPSAIVCPKLNLLQAAYVLQHAQTVIGVDTGLLHLANAFNKQIVGIYTDTDPYKTGVQPSSWAKNLGNIGTVPDVEEVFQAVIEVQHAAKAA